MDSCCEHKKDELAVLRVEHRRTLQLVMAINAAMFAVEAVVGISARSTAVLADALDMFGDASVYALSLYALGRGDLWRARAALAKGVIMAVFGLGVVVEAAFKVARDALPHAPTMGVVGTLALAANGLCFYLLFRHRSDDLNMRSTWLCSRNDIIANVGVLAASGAVALLGAKWPDVVVGLAIAALFLHTAWTVLRDSLRALRFAGRFGRADA